MTNCCAFPLVDALFRWLWQWLRRHRWSILGALTGGFLAYTFMFTNKLPNFDDVLWLFDKGAALVSGRWGLTPLSLVFPDYSMPWLYGVISLALLAVSAGVINDIFDIRHPLLQAVLSAAIVCYPSQIATFTYLFTACAYAVAFLLAVLAVRLVSEGGWVRVLAAVGCLVYSVSIYQAYVAITATLLILLLIRSLLTGSDRAGTLLRRGIGYVLFLGVSMGVYWLITQLLWRFTGTGMGEYAAYAMNESASGLAEGIALAYTTLADELRYGIHGLMPTFPTRLLHMLCFLAVGLEILVWMFRDRRPGSIALMVFLLALLPLSLNCMYLFIAADAIHTLVLYGCAMFYVLFALTAQLELDKGPMLLTLLRRLAREGLVLALVMLTGIQIQIANEAYLNMHLSYENTYSVTNSVISQVQALPGYTRQEPIAILGKYTPPEYYRENFARLERLVAVCGIRPTDYSAEAFWEHYCGFPVTFAEDQRRQELLQSEEYARMPAWPDAGCVQRIGDVIAVKFS